MKKVLKLSILLMVALTSVLAVSCAKSESDQEPLPSEQIIFNGNTIGNGNQEFEIKGKHVISKGTYILKGWVYITAGAQLTIEPGTIIKGDKDTKAALIVEMGGKLIAQGTSTEPIVFTSNQAKGSRKPGDWGGLIICGKAVNNKTTMIIEGGKIISWWYRQCGQFRSNLLCSRRVCELSIQNRPGDQRNHFGLGRKWNKVRPRSGIV